ncbi:hypothetical protein, no similarity [Maudiozyma saulgeensis]|uniref:Eisosome protein SEG1 n=1 Tax=Maudiozyma saulgeensis TaxID=1789683 RepID=A0A1X7R3L8_9SACH|nr:hypothetical protein, no similarity [Kazachstania saulgeensis]
MFRRNDNRYQYGAPQKPMDSSALAAASALGRALQPDGKTVDHSKLPIYNQPSRSASVRNFNRPKSIVAPPKTKHHSITSTATQRHSSLTNTRYNDGRTKTISQSRTNSVHREDKPQSRTRSITGTSQRQQSSSQLKKSTSVNSLREYHRSSSLPTKMSSSNITKMQQHDANTAFADFGDPQFVDALDTLPSHPIKVRTVKKYIPGPNGLISIEVPVNEPIVYEHRTVIPKKSSRSSLKTSQSVRSNLDINNTKNFNSLQAKPKAKIKRSSSMRYSLKTDQDTRLNSMTEVDSGSNHNARHHGHKSNDKLATHSIRAASLNNRTKNPRHTNIIKTSMPEENETTPPVETHVTEKPKASSRHNSPVETTSKAFAKTNTTKVQQGKELPKNHKEPQRMNSSMTKISKKRKSYDFSNGFADFADDSLITNYDTVRPIVLDEEDVSVIKNSLPDIMDSDDKPADVEKSFIEDEQESSIKDSLETGDDHYGRNHNEQPMLEQTTSKQTEENIQNSETVETLNLNLPNGKKEVDDKEQINSDGLNLSENMENTNDETVVDDDIATKESNKLLSSGTLAEHESESNAALDGPYSEIPNDSKDHKSSDDRGDKPNNIEKLPEASNEESEKRTDEKKDNKGNVEDKNTKTNDDGNALEDNHAVIEEAGNDKNGDSAEQSDVELDKSSSVIPTTPAAVSINDFHTPTMTALHGMVTPPSSTSAYVSTEEDMNLRSSVEDIIDSMDAIDVELEGNLDVSLDSTKHIPQEVQENVSNKEINYKGPKTVKENLKPITKTTAIIKPKKNIVDSTEHKVSNGNKRGSDFDRQSPKKDEHKNLAHHLRTANPYLSIPPKSAKRLEDKLKNEKKKEAAVKKLSTLSKGEERNKDISNIGAISRNTLDVPKPKLTKTVTPIKSALKNTPNAKSNSSSMYSDYSPAEGAYLSLTTAENTRLNANIPETFAPPMRQNVSKRYSRPQSMMARVNQRSSSPTPKEKTRLNRNSTIERHSSQIRNSQVKPHSNDHTMKSSLGTVQSVKAASLAINPSTNDQQSIKRSGSFSKSVSIAKKKAETKGFAFNGEPTARRRMVNNNKTSRATTTGAATTNNGIDPNLVGILYPRELPQKKSSFEKLRTNDSHLGFKKMSLRDESIMNDNQQEENTNETHQNGEPEEENVVSSLLKSGGWTSRFQDSDSDDDFTEKLSGSKGSSKISSPTKESKSRLTNGLSMFKGRQTADNSEQNHHSNYHVHPPHSNNAQRSVSTPNHQANSNNYSNRNGYSQFVDPNRVNSAGKFSNQVQQSNDNNERRVLSNTIQNSNTGRMSGRTLTKVENGDGSNKKQGGFGKKLKKIFGRKKNDM